MSGPPPWTTLGFSPPYLSSTTPRGKSSRSAGPFMAPPPYLITTVLPWNSRMYGSASSSVATSRAGRAGSGRVFGIEAHIFVAEVREEPLGLGALAREVDLVLDLIALHGGPERLGVMGHALAALAHRHALDRHVAGERRGAGHGHPDRLDDPAPVGIPAVQRSLDQRRV